VRTRSSLLRLAAAIVMGACFTIVPSAQMAPTIKYSDTKLPNGLRVIISEDQ
jgi:hypothetical protein